MILSTHAIVGGAIASLIPDQPALAFVAGIVSHFVIDAIPHSDYLRIPIYSGRVFRLEAGHRSDLKPATIPK
ncbi:hypothetical protein [Bradyrhizobium sp. SSUT77]|uniref:hypothetical protein n=1 Tax=Bradyrhizobium sp. SSUT77 TaxID=3040603 RepID=UPI002446C58B|nr:hypothetical protein [Bradyrhizobium sp. SSUT77]MDH2348696.1 hypothetical protein [Bradyrhizobium sp. SSUT77]